MSFHDIAVNTLDGKPLTLAAYRGKTVLVVNVASQCGLTPQYAGLQALQEKYSAKGFAVLGFPCNQFGGQEPGSAEEIRGFCDTNYKVSFPLFAKIEVNGAGTHPLYKYLKSGGKGTPEGDPIKWNFAKFLVGPDGAVLKRYAPTDSPESVAADLDKLLK